MHTTPRASADIVAAPGNSGYLVRAYPGGHFLPQFFTCKRDAATYAHLVVSDGYIAAVCTLDALRAPAIKHNIPAPLTTVSNTARFAYEPPAPQPVSDEDILTAFGPVAYWKREYRRLLTLMRAAETPKRERILRILMEDALNNIAIHAA